MPFLMHSKSWQRNDDKKYNNTQNTQPAIKQENGTNCQTA